MELGQKPHAVGPMLGSIAPSLKEDMAPSLKEDMVAWEQCGKKPICFEIPFNYYP